MEWPTGLEIWACEWDDAHCNTDEFERDKIIHRPAKYITVGVLLKNDDIGVSMASDVEQENGRFRGTNFIPKKMVVKVWKVGALAESRRKKRASKNHPEMDLLSQSISDKPLPLPG